MTTFKWHAATPLTVKGARDFWETRYQHSVTPWDRGATNPALTRWLRDDTLQPCKILIPGCGRGYEVVELATRGFAVTALDISPLVIEELEKTLEERGLQAELVVADGTRWVPQATFAAVYEQTCLCALLPEQWPVYIHQLGSWLGPGGSLFALFMQTDRAGGPPFDCPLSRMEELFGAEQWHWRDGSFEVPHSPGFREIACILDRM